LRGPLALPPVSLPVFGDGRGDGLQRPRRVNTCWVATICFEADPRASQTSAGLASRSVQWSDDPRGGQANRAGRADAQPAIDVNRAAVQLHQPLGKRQAQPGSFLENPHLIRQRDTRTGIRHRDDQLPGRAQIGLDRYMPARRREFDRIGHEVQQHLPQPALVAAYRIDSGTDGLGQLHATARRARGHQVNDEGDKIRYRDGVFLQFEIPRLGLGVVEDVVDQGAIISRRAVRQYLAAA
jgi:hypothetical protein